MRTHIYVDPARKHARIKELLQAQTKFEETFPQAPSGFFTYRGERWQEDAFGFRLTIKGSIKELPLFLSRVPIYRIHLVDTIEDPIAENRVTGGAYEADDAWGTVEERVNRTPNSALAMVYNIDLWGTGLTAVNDLYAKIRQGQTSPAHIWGLVAPIPSK